MSTSNKIKRIKINFEICMKLKFQGLKPCGKEYSYGKYYHSFHYTFVCDVGKTHLVVSIFAKRELNPTKVKMTCNKCYIFKEPFLRYKV